MKKVTALIAAKNEGPRIGNVLKAACSHPLIDEVVVVVNGCTDNTEEVATSFKTRVIKDDTIKGKTLAIKRGLQEIKNEFVVLLDADLVGIKEDQLTALISPAVEEKVDFTLSLRKNSALLYKFFGIDFVSGERVIAKELLEDPLIWSKPKIGFSLEVLMNKSLLSRKKTFISVPMKDMVSIRKSQKENYFRGAAKDVFMVFNIFKALPFYEVIWQFFKMAWLNGKYKRLNNKTTK